MSDERVVMATYFKTLEQAEKHIQHTKTMGRSEIDWCIVDCNIGFLVLSEAQARRCFPDISHGSQAYLTKIESTS
jgi:hypothetical protein